MGSCSCPRQPSCEGHSHAGPEGTCTLHGHITFAEPPWADRPCIWCNGPTQQTGACRTCLACGATTSC